jgi:hypothetical protein
MQRDRIPRAHVSGRVRRASAYYRNLSQDFKYLGVAGPVVYAIPIASMIEFSAAYFQGLDHTSRILVALSSIGLAGIVYLSALKRLLPRRGRIEVFERLRKYGVAILSYYLIVVLADAIAFFTFVTLLIANERWVEFQGSSHHIMGPRPIASFYIWHFVDSIPLLDLDTVKVEAPLHYSEVRIGLLVIAFRLAVASPIIASASLAGAGRSSVTSRCGNAGRASCRPGMAGPPAPQAPLRGGGLRRRR